MKIIYPRMNFAFDIMKNELNHLVIESAESLYQFVLDLYEDINGNAENFRVSNDGISSGLQKCATFVLSPIDFEYDKRALNKNFLSYMKQEIDESDLSQRIVEKYSEMQALIEELYYLSDVPIEYNTLVTENDIFKHFDIHIKPPEGSFAEKIIDYCSVLQRLSEKDVIIIVNCEAYMEEKDYEYLRKYCESEDMYIVFVSNRQFTGYMCSNTCIIDKDMCELR